MALLSYIILLVCLSAYSESTVISKEPGGSINLTCSSDECPDKIDGYNFLYLFHEKDEVLFFPFTSKSEPMPRGKYERRIQIDRSTMTFTISNLTVNDQGIYKCVFKKTDKVFVSCSIYGVFITETKSGPMMPPTKDPTKDSTFVVPRTTLMLFIILICVISVLAMWIFFLLITPRVKQWCIRRRRAGGDQKVSTDNVYEIMSRDARGQAAA